MMTCSPGHGRLNNTRLFPTTIKMNPTGLIHQENQCGLTQLMMKHVPVQAPYRKTARKKFPKGTGYITHKTDTNHDSSQTVVKTPEHLNPSPTNPRNTNFD